jgi:serine/threonine protein kinase
LIQLYAAYVHKETGCVHVALEYMDYGSLQDVKNNVTLVPESILALIMMQILEGLKWLHLSYVVHRDVKLGNILVNSHGTVKVTDFGISKKLGESAVCDTFVGTATHMSPERVLGEDYSYAADIWSLGLCVYELASGVYPYGSIASFPVLFDNLCNKQEPRLSAGKFSPALCSFVERQLQRKPELRASAIQLQAHAYILSNLSQVRQEDLIKWLNDIMRESKGGGDILSLSGHGSRRLRG